MTGSGFLISIVGLCLFCKSRKWLYKLLVFSLPFSATAIFNLGSGAEASGLQAWMFLATLWLIRELVPQFAQLNVKLKKTLRAPALYLGAFFLIAAVSLLMPIWIDGSLQIVSPLLMDFSTTPLVFRAGHVFALAYLLLGGTLCLMIAQHNTAKEMLMISLKVYLAAAVFVALWGLLQVGCYATGLPYPAFLFNNSASPGAMGYSAEFTEIGIKRVSSVAVESSILAQFLLTSLPLTLPAWFNRGCIFSRRMDKACGAVMLLVLILTTSSVAYIGLFCLLLILLLLLATKVPVVRARVLAVRLLIGSVALVASFFAAYAASGTFQTLMNATLIDKAGNYSGLERLKSIYFAAQYFLQYPILGVGWGSVTSHDLLFKLLANVGLAGFCAFAVLVVSIGRRLYRRLGNEDVARSTLLTLSIFLSFMILIITNALSEFAYVFGYSWFVIGIAMLRAYQDPTVHEGTAARDTIR